MEEEKALTIPIITKMITITITKGLRQSGGGEGSGKSRRTA